MQPNPTPHVSEQAKLTAQVLEESWTFLRTQAQQGFFWLTRYFHQMMAYSRGNYQKTWVAEISFMNGSLGFYNLRFFHGQKEH